jgi:large subunit ribosomal protein L22
MEVKANLRYLRMAPRKVRLVADLIRGKGVEEAEKILSFTKKRAALPLLKLLKSAIANAKHNFNLDEKNLFVSKILVNEGPRLKRIFPRARGRADIRQKKISHITLILSELTKGEKKARAGD